MTTLANGFVSNLLVPCDVEVKEGDIIALRMNIKTRKARVTQQILDTGGYGYCLELEPDTGDLGNAATRLERLERYNRKMMLLRRYLKFGDVILHTRCMGAVAEHTFHEWLQTPFKMFMLKGRATVETRKHVTGETLIADDISPMNVTHINRNPIDSLELLEELGVIHRNEGT